MMSPTALHHMVVSLRRRHANFYFPYEAKHWFELRRPRFLAGADFVSSNPLFAGLTSTGGSSMTRQMRGAAAHPLLHRRDAAGIDWRTTAQLVSSLDPEVDLGRAQLVYDTHLARAHWMTRVGYRLLLK
jgi:hypothetical protein